MAGRFTALAENNQAACWENKLRRHWVTWKNGNRMEDKSPDSVPPRYRWPWFVLAALVLGVLLALMWMTVEVRRIRRQQSSNPWAAPAANGSNTAR